MLKKRLIFTLLHAGNGFMLSRNFRLQKVGNTQWLKKNYNFFKTAESIDELIVLNVAKTRDSFDDFLLDMRDVVKECFLPVAAGGGIRSMECAKQIISSGADKLVLNTVLYKDPGLVSELISIYGSQCIVASVDYRIEGQNPIVYVEGGQEKIEIQLEEYLANLESLGVGEVMLNSIDKDGTGQEFELKIFEHIPNGFSVPIIMSGGAGNGHHLLNGLKESHVDAVATADLFNFIGTGLSDARKIIIDGGIELAYWPTGQLSSLKTS